MIVMTPIELDGTQVTGITVDLPQTKLTMVTTGKGYIMCGALDVAVLNTRLAARRVIAGRAFGVRSVEDLLEAPLADVTDEARSLGIEPGMKGRRRAQVDAVKRANPRVTGGCRATYDAMITGKEGGPCMCPWRRGRLWVCRRPTLRCRPIFPTGRYPARCD